MNIINKIKLLIIVGFFSLTIKANSNPWGLEIIDTMPIDYHEIKPEEILKFTDSKSLNNMFGIASIYHKSRNNISQENLQSGYSGGIQAFYRYKPKEYNKNKKPILLVVVHGTYATNNKEFYDYDNKTFQAILKFGKEYTQSHKSILNTISFRWNGENNSSKRKAAGKELAWIIKNYFSNYKIITWAHSHGCNVVSAASQYLDNQPITNMINLAAPVRDTIERDPEFKPKYFKKLIHFYSSSDLFALLGAINLRDLTNFKLINSVEDIFKFSPQKNKKIINIKVLIDNKSPNHFGFKKEVTNNLYSIMQKIKPMPEYYTSFINLSANI